MKTMKDTIENGFERLAYITYGHPYKTLIITLLLSVALFSQIFNLRVDVTEENMFHHDDPTFKEYAGFKDQFGRDDVVVIGIKSSNTFSVSFLEKIKKFHLDLEEETPFLDEITSLYNATAITGSRNELIVKDLMEDWHGGHDEVEAIRSFVLSNSLYLNRLISEKGDFTVVAVKADVYLDGNGSTIDESLSQDENRSAISNLQMQQFVEALEKTSRRYDSEDFQLFITGSPVIEKEHVSSIHSDIGLMIVLATVMIFVLLFVVFRRVSGVLFPLLVVASSLTAVLSLMALLGLPISPASQAIPPFILTVGVGDAVHLLTIFFRQLKQTENKQQSLVYALKHSGLPMLFTSLTTAGAFASFYGAELKPISDIGIVTPIGVLLAFVYTVVLLPALISLTGFKTGSLAKRQQETSIDKALIEIGGFAVNHSKKIVFISLLLAGVSLVGASKLGFSYNMLSWFPEDRKIRQDTERFDAEMGTSITIEVVLDTKKENGLYDPEFQSRLEQLNKYAEGLSKGDFQVARSVSIVDTLKQIHMALNENDRQFHSVPKNREVIAQELLLFENSGADDLEDLVDSQFSKARITIYIPWEDAVNYLWLTETLRLEVNRIFGETVTVSITGSANLTGKSVLGMMNSMARSYVIASIVIVVLMILMIGSVRVGMLSMIPNFLPIMMTLGTMGFLGLPLDMFTILLGGIALGVAVDDTVHFMHTFRRVYLRSRDVEAAVRHTMQLVGRALLFTTIALSGGYFVLVFASMNNLFKFGIVIGITILMAFLADIIISPALMALVYKNTPKGSEVEMKTNKL